MKFTEHKKLEALDVIFIQFSHQQGKLGFCFAGSSNLLKFRTDFCYVEYGTKQQSCKPHWKAAMYWWVGSFFCCLHQMYAMYAQICCACHACKSINSMLEQSVLDCTQVRYTIRPQFRGLSTEGPMQWAPTLPCWIASCWFFHTFWILPPWILSLCSNVMH